MVFDMVCCCSVLSAPELLLLDVEEFFCGDLLSWAKNTNVCAISDKSLTVCLLESVLHDFFFLESVMTVIKKKK